MKALWVLYDDRCGFCCSCASWLKEQAQLVDIACVPRGSESALALFGEIESHGEEEELIVIDDDGGVYRDTDAWVMTLWALRDYREWSLRLSNPMLKPVARSLFGVVSSNRGALSKVLALQPDSVVRVRLERLAPEHCDDGHCAVEERGEARFRSQ